MRSFWVKIAVFAVIVVGLVVLVKFLSGGIEQATDFEKPAELMKAQEARLQAELAEAERKAKEAKQTAAPPKAPAATSDEEKVATNLQAQRLYQMAEVEFKIGRKPFMSFKRCVDYCRELIEKYPDSAEAAKARVLLSRIPQRHRKQFKITDEEMGL